MTEDPRRAALESALVQWAARRQQSDETRDGLLVAAIAAGVSKHRVHILTGIARTTIDRILAERKESEQ